MLNVYLINFLIFFCSFRFRTVPLQSVNFDVVCLIGDHCAFIKSNNDFYTRSLHHWPWHRNRRPLSHCATGQHFFLQEPVTEINGGPDLFINKGSTINLTCIVKYAPEPPPAVVWKHNRDVSTRCLSFCDTGSRWVLWGLRCALERLFVQPITVCRNVSLSQPAPIPFAGH